MLSSVDQTSISIHCEVELSVRAAQCGHCLRFGGLLSGLREFEMRFQPKSVSNGLQMDMVETCVRDILAPQG